MCITALVRSTDIAPEVLNGSYTRSADVYSFGICMSEVLTGRVPYCDDDAEGMLATETKRVDRAGEPEVGRGWLGEGVERVRQCAG